ncbi:SGNH/GDSL hydrolase family protein [Candidatus Beckwithbacteria bacterium]|nr:SGNH/GDSL hydrolase family protein [Candidatus Beckwithbacteria bacterium]
MKLKFLLIFFALGALFGLGVSPWLNTRPQQVLLSPVSQIEAYSEPETDTQSQSNVTETGKTIDSYFAYFDHEQNKLLASNPSEIPQVLGAETSSHSGHSTIAVFGDSMTDTMGTNLPYLASALESYYPNMDFDLLNYGIGSQNVTQGLARVTQNYSYQDRNYPPITQANADLIIVESFAYNPLDASEIGTYQQNLSSLLSQLKNSNAKVVFLATIAPLKSKFGQGPGGVNWDQDTAWNHATKIQSFLEAGLATASNLGIPTLDLYHATLQDNGEGIASLVSTHDGIHPSVAGHTYIAQQLAAYILKNQLL